MGDCKMKKLPEWIKEFYTLLYTEQYELAVASNSAKDVIIDATTMIKELQDKLSKKPKSTEFTKECRELIRTPDDAKGWTELAGYTCWLEVKLQRACDIIDQQAN